MENKDLAQDLSVWRKDFDDLRTRIARLTTHNGDVMIRPQFDNAYHLKQALQHLSDCQLQTFEAIKIGYGKGDVYGE